MPTISQDPDGAIRIEAECSRCSGTGVERIPQYRAQPPKLGEICGGCNGQGWTIVWLKPRGERKRLEGIEFVRRWVDPASGQEPEPPVPYEEFLKAVTGAVQESR